MGPGAGAPVLYSILMMRVVCVVVMMMGLFGMVMFVAGFGAAKALRVGKSLGDSFPTQAVPVRLQIQVCRGVEKRAGARSLRDDWC